MTAAVSQENGAADASPHKVFVGNLSFSVDREKLVEFFTSAGKVVDAVAITRYGRPAGYGFVTFESDASCDKAVSLKDTELEGRKINIEKAVPRDEMAPRRGRGRGRGRGAAGRGGRAPRSPPTGEPSKTVLFVGNLPFNVIDEDLHNIFNDFTVAAAHVVRMYNGASRGFGFVTLSSEEEQERALKKLAEVWCDDRKLIIRPALSNDTQKNGEKQHEVVIKQEGTA